MNKPVSQSASLATSHSLLGRIGRPDDNESWQQFLTKYRAVLFALAKKKGLTDAEAADAVQETLIAVANNIAKFTQTPARSFRPWLFKITNSKIINQIRTRLPIHKAAARSADASQRTGTIERVPNPTSVGFEAHWDNEDRDYLTQLALEKLRASVAPKHYQIYHAYAVKGWGIDKVVAAFGVSANNVHKVHERLKKKFQHELSRLENL